MQQPCELRAGRHAQDRCSWRRRFGDGESHDWPDHCNHPNHRSIPLPQAQRHHRRRGLSSRPTHRGRTAYARAQIPWATVPLPQRPQGLSHRHHAHAFRHALRPANQDFIHFHPTGKAVTVRPNHCGTKAMQHRPGRLVGTEAQDTLKRLCRNTVFPRGHVPRNREPDCERSPRAMEDCSRCHRHATSAGLTPEPFVTESPAPTASAVRAHETMRPAQPIKIVETGSIIGNDGDTITITELLKKSYNTERIFDHEKTRQQIRKILDYLELKEE